MAASRDFSSLQSSGSLGSFFPSNATPLESLLRLEGGIPPDLFVEEVDKQFLCGLCNKVLRYPMQTGCGCRFCYGCLYNFIG